MSRDVGEPVDIRAEDAAVVSVVRYDIRPHVGLALLLVSFFWFSASALVIGIAAVLGSVALVGSNRGTLGEIITGIRLAEARRAEVIDGLQLETISPEDDPGDFHYEPRRG